MRRWRARWFLVEGAGLPPTRGRAWTHGLNAATEMIPSKPTRWHPGRQIATAIDNIWIGSPWRLLTQTYQHGQ
eukprot:8706020-Pyramimonas_sp.AAC.1